MEIDELAQPSLTSSSSSGAQAPAAATAAAEAKLSVTELGQGQGQGQTSGMPESLRAMPPSSTSTSSSDNGSAAATEVVGAVEEVEEEEEEEEDEEEEEEEDVCRICRNNGEEANPLHYPCACSGSIKYVHQDCLLQWLNHSNTRHCEVCKHPFSFSPVYAEDAPTRLPFREFVFGIATKTCRSLHFILRLAFVISVWFVIIPFTTFWIWRLAFIRSFVDAQKLFLSHMSPSPLLQDCFHGLVLSAGIVFIFLGATSLRDYFRYLRELRGHEAGREDEVMDRQQRQARRLQGNRANVDGVNGEAVQEQLLRRNAENVAARLEIQAPPLEPHVEQIFDGVDDADGAEDVPFDELVGMQGPVFHLVENAITVLASNAIFLAVVIFLPFTLGRIVLYLLSRILVSTSSGVVAESIASSVSDLSIASMSLDAVANMSAKVQVSTAISEALINDSLINVVNESNSAVFFTKGNSIEVLTMAGVTSLQVSDVATLSVGYMVILGLLFSYFAILALIRYNRGEPLTEGRIYGIASMAEAIPSLGRQFLAGVKYFMTMVKVGFLLVVELGVFPLLCGWWLDVCTISMLGTTISQRVAFFWTSPLTSTLLHWFVGILYMLQISIFVSLLRGVLRPGVLYFLRDPADPNYNPFRDLIDDPIHKHARRVLLSSVVYGSLIVMLVFLPVKLAMYLAPTIFPLDTSVSDPFTEIPADMLLFQICIPFAIEHFRPRATIKKILSHWFTVVCWVLGLTDYLLPNPDDDNTQAGEMADQVQQDRVNNVHRDGLGERHFNGLEQNQNLLALPALGDDNRAVGHENSSSSVDNQELAGDNSSDSEEYMFVIRIVVLLFLAWLTLLSFNSAMIVVPVSLGRAVFAAIPRLPITHGIKCNDFYAFNIGCYIIWAAVAGIGYAIDYFKSHNMRALLIQVFKWSSIVVKSSILLSLWIIVIPVLIGLLFDLLVVVPFRVPVNESPVFLLYQDWSFGLVFLKVWTRLVMYGHVGPLFDESWRIKFERVRADGFSRLRGLWVFQEIVAPILMKLLTALCVPYVFARGLFPLFGYSLLINSVVYRFAWLGCLAMGSLWYCMKRFQQWFLNLHNSIRDDRYLIGRRLHNYGERSSSQARSSNNQRTVEVPNSQTSNAEQDSGIEDAGSSSESLGSEIGTSGRQNEVAENLRQRRPRVEIMD